MLKLQRLLIKDNQNNLFRILKFGGGTQEKFNNEPYIKICFPYFKNIKLYKFDKPGKMTDNLFNGMSYKQTGVNEFTYHYKSGISHFKFSNEHTENTQFRNLPTIESKIPIHLLTVYIFDLNPVPIFKKTIDKKDFILTNEFNIHNGRIIDIYIRQLKFTPEIIDRSDINYFDKYDFEDKKFEIGLSLIDYEFKTKPNKTGILVSRPNDPHSKFSN